MNSAPVGDPQPDEQRGREVLAAWEQGEHSGDYSAFRGLLGQVRLFSHPYLGRFEGLAAAEQLEGLMLGREAKPNRLTFSNVVVSTAPGVAVCLFDSAGLIGGETEYSGYNAIAFMLEGDRVIGFREYFGTS